MRGDFGTEAGALRVIIQVVIVVALSTVVGLTSLPLMSLPYIGCPCAKASIRLPTPPHRQRRLFPPAFKRVLLNFNGLTALLGDFFPF